MLIVLESINGAGTSTQTNLLHEAMPGSILTRHPGSTDLGKNLRSMLKFGDFKTSPQQELFLFAADAMAFMQNIVKPNSDKVIICDRLNITGSLTYQLAGGANLGQVQAMCNMLQSCGWDMKVDKLFVFSMPYSLAKSRLVKPNLIDQDKKQGDKKDNFEKRGDEYMERVSQNYENILTDNRIQAMLKPFVNEIIRIDATDTIDGVFTQIKKHLPAELFSRQLTIEFQ